MDLHWDRMYAGHYETQWFVNKYRYKIIGEGIDWACYYMYYAQDPDKRVWRALRYAQTDRLKHAKELCAAHNISPRRKWRIAGRSRQNVFRNGEFVNIERLDFKEAVVVRGVETLKEYGQIHVELPAFYESYSKPYVENPRIYGEAHAS